MTATRRPAPPTGADALMRQIDHRVRSLRSASRVLPAPRPPAGGIPATNPAYRPAGVDLVLAERIAEALRRLVAETALASAADRARVRAAVHYFVLSREGREGRRADGLRDGLRVVNEILVELGRDDLVIEG